MKKFRMLAVLAGWLWVGLSGSAFGGDLDAGRLENEAMQQLSVINEEIGYLKENLAWLGIKIGQMQGLNQPVPRGMSASVAYKKKRIAALEHTREQIRSLPLAHLTDILKDRGLSGVFKIVNSPAGPVMKSTSPILFPSGSARISETYHSFLKRVARLIGDHKVWVLVDGYTDTDPIRTSKYPSNLELGAIRAANVVHTLVRYGADPAKFKVASPGEHRQPQDPPYGHNKAAERNVSLTIYPVQSSG